MDVFKLFGLMIKAFMIRGKKQAKFLVYIFRFSSGVEEPASETSTSEEPSSKGADTTCDQFTIVDQTCDQPRKRHNSGHKVGFNPEWQQGRPWLKVQVDVGENDAAVTSMICSLCQEFSSFTPYISSLLIKIW